MVTTVLDGRDPDPDGSLRTEPRTGPASNGSRRGPIAARLAFAAVAAAVVMLPMLRPAGPGNSAPDDVMIGTAVAMTFLALVTTRARVRLPYVVPVAVLVIAGALAAMVNEPTSAAVLALGQDLLVFCFAAAIANAIRTTRTLGAVLRVWAISASVWAAVLVGAVVAGNDALAGVTSRTGTRASLTFGDANLAANYFVISLLVVVAVRTPRRRSLRWPVYGLLVGAVMATGSLGGILTLVLAVGAMIAVKVARRSGVVTAIAVVLLVGPLAVLAVRGGYDVLTSAAQDPGSVLHDSFGRVSSSTQSRDLIISEDLRLYSTAAMIGNGPTSTKDALARTQSPYVKEAHNDYLATAIERGALGLLGLVCLIGAAALRSRQALQRARSSAVAQVLPNAAALVVALLVVACSGVFYEVLHFRHVWALLGIVAALGFVRDPGAEV